MLAYLVESRKPETPYWYPIAVVGNDLNMNGVEIITYLKERYPNLINYEIRLRTFRRIPGIYPDNVPNNIIVIDQESLSDKESPVCKS